MEACGTCVRGLCSHCKFSLRIIADICGIIGVMLRLILIILAIIEIAEIDDDPKGVGTLIILSVFSYCMFTLATNIAFVFGILKEKPFLLLPHTLIAGLEIIFIAIYIIIGPSRVESLNYDYNFWSYTPLYILVIGITVGTFVCSILLFRRMHKKVTTL